MFDCLPLLIELQAREEGEGKDNMPQGWDGWSPQGPFPWKALLTDQVSENYQTLVGPIFLPFQGPPRKSLRATAQGTPPDIRPIWHTLTRSHGILE